MGSPLQRLRERLKSWRAGLRRAVRSDAPPPMAGGVPYLPGQRDEVDRRAGHASRREPRRAQGDGAGETPPDRETREP